MSVSALPTLDDVKSAAAALRGVARLTPVLTEDLLDEVSGSTVSVKAEFLQRGGAYKFRGVYNKIRLLDETDRARGIVTVSSGNAGIAAAYAARLHGAACTVVMPACPRLTRSWRSKRSAAGCSATGPRRPRCSSGPRSLSATG